MGPPLCYLVGLRVFGFAVIAVVVHTVNQRAIKPQQQHYPCAVVVYGQLHRVGAAVVAVFAPARALGGAIKLGGRAGHAPALGGYIDFFVVVLPPHRIACVDGAAKWRLLPGGVDCNGVDAGLADRFDIGVIVPTEGGAGG